MDTKVGEKLFRNNEDGLLAEWKVAAVNDEHNAILYEDTSGVENNGCNTLHLKEFFPDYQFDFYKQYFIKINDVIYHGDTFEQVFWDYVERFESESEPH